MLWIAGGYPAAPTDEPAAARRFTDLLLAGADGLELNHGPDGLDPEVARAAAATGTHVVTAVPLAAVHAGADPTWGLASPDPDGRRAALASAEQVRRSVADLADAAGRPAVAAVELHSAPGMTEDALPGSSAALADSLAELTALDWSGATVLIEHCDRRGGVAPTQKGFLSVDEELEALVSQPDSGLVINWARSAIETRDPASVPEQVARAGNRLAGLMFSGVAAQVVDAMPPWADAHLNTHEQDEVSLLGQDQIDRTVAAAAVEPAFVGVKVRQRPGDRTAADRADGVLSALEQVRRAWQSPPR